MAVQHVLKDNLPSLETDKQAKEGEMQPDVLQKLLANLNRTWLVDALLT
jgi:hypothetical protein